MWGHDPETRQHASALVGYDSANPAGVAQLAEQPSCKRQVSGSIPLTGSQRPGPVSQHHHDLQSAQFLVVVVDVAPGAVDLPLAQREINPCTRGCSPVLVAQTRSPWLAGEPVFGTSGRWPHRQTRGPARGYYGRDARSPGQTLRREPISLRPQEDIQRPRGDVSDGPVWQRTRRWRLATVREERE
jgi:hypothetical protein